MTPKPHPDFDPDERAPWDREDGESDARFMVHNARSRAHGGGAILDAPETVESVWGDGHRCLWPKGEPFILCGPDGVGKTTVAQQLVLHLIGAIPGPFLGLGVQPEGRVLYLACDRLPQALRSFRRMVGESDREVLEKNLTIWFGPLAFGDLVRQQMGLVEMAQEFDAQTVVIDSLKDVAPDLSKEESGLGLNNSFQNAIAEGIDVMALHHQRKQQTGATKPRHLSDVYGSRWITAGTGSVVMLWGDAGDSVVELNHLKSPDEEVGPLKVIHDHTWGVTTLAENVDTWSMVNRAKNGISAATIATALFEIPTPSRNQTEKARRQLERLFREEKIHKVEGAKGGRAGENATLYFPLTSRQG
jgi:replicative DNA helicase